MAAAHELPPRSVPARRAGPWACGVVCLHASSNARTAAR